MGAHGRAGIGAITRRQKSYMWIIVVQLTDKAVEIRTRSERQREAEALARAITCHLSREVYLASVALFSQLVQLMACAYLVSIWVLDDAARKHYVNLRMEQAYVLPQDNHITMICKFPNVKGVTGNAQFWVSPGCFHRVLCPDSERRYVGPRGTCSAYSREGPQQIYKLDSAAPR